MKFKKRNLTEEIGLPRSNKKTFTKNKKQKVRITEAQLQRLLGIVSEQNVNTPGAPNPKDYKKGGQDPKYLADKKAFLKKYKAKKGKGTKPTTGGPTPPPAPNFNMSTWSPGFKKKIDTFLKNKNIKGAERFLKGQVDGWKKKSMKAGPKWKKQLKAKTDFAMKLMKDVEKAKASTKKPLNENKQLLTEWWLLAIQLWKVWVSWKEWRDMKVVPGGGNDPKEWAEFKSQYSGKLEQLKRESGKMPNSWRELEQLKNEGMRNNKPQTSPFKKMCCRDRNGVITSAANGRCPKSSTKVPCKGTPPTQGNITTENKKRLKEQSVYYQCIDGTCTPAFIPNPSLPQFNTLQDCQNSECGEANQGGEMDRDMEMGRDMKMDKEVGRYNTPENMKACKAAGGNESLCSKHLRSGTMPPKPSGTPQGKWILGGFFCCVMRLACCEGSPIDTIKDMFGENRTLKTTNPITESEIKDMKKWFNRVNKAGREYNPGRL